MWHSNASTAIGTIVSAALLNEQAHVPAVASYEKSYCVSQQDSHHYHMSRRFVYIRSNGFRKVANHVIVAQSDQTSMIYDPAVIGRLLCVLLSGKLLSSAALGRSSGDYTCANNPPQAALRCYFVNP
jgi:hypothetical protein